MSNPQDFETSSLSPFSAVAHRLNKKDIIPFLLTACLYQLSFSTVDYIIPDFWLFGTDSAAQCWEQLTSHHCNWELARHPVPILFGTVLYHAGVFVFSWLSDPYATNFAGQFPNTLIGGWNACLAIALFRTIGFSSWRPYLLGLTYATSTSIWVIASFPETWIWSTLATNLFLLAFLQNPKSPRFGRLAMLNALAAFCAPPLLMIGILPVFQWFRYQPFLSAIKTSFRYGLALLLVFFIPWSILLFVDYEHGFSTYFLRSALNEGGEAISADMFMLGPLFYGVFAFVPSWLPSSTYINLRWLPFEAFLNTRAVLGALPLIAYMVGSIVVGRAKFPFSGSKSIFLFLILFAAFMIVHLPCELFLYTSPVVLPLWLLIHACYLRKEEHLRWRLAVIALCVNMFVLNALYICRLRDVECFDPTWGVSRNCRSEENWNPRPYRLPGVSEEQRRSKLYLEW